MVDTDALIIPVDARIAILCVCSVIFSINSFYRKPVGSSFSQRAQASFLRYDLSWSKKKELQKN